MHQPRGVADQQVELLVTVDVGEPDARVALRTLQVRVAELGRAVVVGDRRVALRLDDRLAAAPLRRRLAADVLEQEQVAATMSSLPSPFRSTAAGRVQIASMRPSSFSPLSAWAASAVGRRCCSGRSGISGFPKSLSAKWAPEGRGSVRVAGTFRVNLL
ncbi:MAG: hypothetical protein ACK52I_30110 [Pseudomonadota bacterium]